MPCPKTDGKLSTWQFLHVTTLDIGEFNSFQYRNDHHQPRETHFCSYCFCYCTEGHHHHHRRTPHPFTLKYKSQSICGCCLYKTPLYFPLGHQSPHLHISAAIHCSVQKHDSIFVRKTSCEWWHLTLWASLANLYVYALSLQFEQIVAKNSQLFLTAFHFTLRPTLLVDLVLRIGHRCLVLQAVTIFFCC